MKVKIQLERAMSNTTFHKRCNGMQRYWWLKCDAKTVDRNNPYSAPWKVAPNGFVRLTGRRRGDDDLKLELDLEPGVYTAGAGPVDWGTRLEFEVTKKSVKVISYQYRGRFKELSILEYIG